MLLVERTDSNACLWTKRLKRLTSAARELHRAQSYGVNESQAAGVLAPALTKPRPCDPRNPRSHAYEENRNTFWTGTQFSAGVCRAGESENRRQRYCRGVRQDRQSDPGRTVRLRRGDRSNFTGRAVLSRLAEERCADWHRGHKQSVLVEPRRQILQQPPCNP